MAKTVTLTMNPAIDVSTQVVRVAPERKLRCKQPRHEPGGGGINVAMAMHQLGESCTAVFPAGGPPGEMLRTLIDQRGIDFRTVEIANWTRSNVAVLDTSTDEQYRLVMPGPVMDETVCKQVLDLIGHLDDHPEYLVVSGSLPPGIEASFVRELADFCSDRRIRCLLDTSGKALQEGARSGVYLLKPNLRELQELVHRELTDEAQQEAALRELVQEGRAEIAVLSLGAGGIVCAEDGGAKRFRAPTVPIVSRVGAGDSMVAGIVVGLLRGMEIESALRYGMAAGSAAVMTPGTELCRSHDVEHLFRNMARE